MVELTHAAFYKNNFSLTSAYRSEGKLVMIYVSNKIKEINYQLLASSILVTDLLGSQQNFK